MTQASGAQEIRKAAYEFDRMAKRINRHLNQRSEMLSGISHDLRTSDKIKTSLAMINQKIYRKNVKRYRRNGSNKLNDYLSLQKQKPKKKLLKLNYQNFLMKLKKILIMKTSDRF